MFVPMRSLVAYKDIEAGSVLDEAADRDGSDVPSCRNGLCERQADVDQRRSAQVSNAGDRDPDRLGDLAVRLRPELTAGDTNLVEDADIVVRELARKAEFGHGNDPRIYAQQPLDHRVAAGLLSNLPDHRVERVLPVLDSTTRKSPVSLAPRWYVTRQQHSPVLDAHGIRRQPETHARTVAQRQHPQERPPDAAGLALRLTPIEEDDAKSSAPCRSIWRRLAKDGEADDL